MNMPEQNKEWEVRFDEKFTNKILIDWRKYDIKDFIRSERHSLLKEILEKIGENYLEVATSPGRLIRKQIINAERARTRGDYRGVS